MIMFGHLKAVEFTNLVEGAPLGPKRREHLERCQRCRTTLEALSAVRQEVSSMDRDLPEVDWDRFRSSVRDELLSRAIQRESTVRRWTGWPMQPAVAWVLPVIFVIAVTTLVFVWHYETSHSPNAGVENPQLNTGLNQAPSRLPIPGKRTGDQPSVTVEEPPPAPVEPILFEAEMIAWSETGIFEELMDLDGAEEQQFRDLLASAQQGNRQ